MTEERLRVLLLDDEKSLREPLKDYLKKNFGYHVDAVASGEEALRLVEEAQGHYDVALIDEVLTDGLNGIQVMQEINVRYPDVESIIFTGWGNESRQRALQAGAFRYLEKPFDTDELAMLIRTAGQQVRLRDIGRAILSERDLDRVLERIDAAASSLALADEAAITLQNPVTGKIQVYTKTYTAKQEWKKHFRDRDLSREIIQTGQMVRVSDTKQDDRVDPEVIEAGIRTFVGVPIPGEGGSLGVLYVYSQQSGRFDEGSTVAVLQTLASQAGLAIANARAFQQTQAHAGYMEALVRAGQGLTRTTRLEDQLAIAWNFVRNQLKVATFFVGLYDKQADMLRFPLAYDEDRQMEIPNRRLGDDPKQWGITGHVVKTGQELCWFRQEDARKQCRSLGIKGIQVGKPCQSCFYLPLKIGDEVVGAVSIQSYDRYAFTSTLLDACRALGGQLAVALENARLFQAEAQQRQEAETLREIALALTTTLEQQEIFERILSELQKVVPYDSASVQLLKGDCLEIIAGRGFPNLSEVLGASFPVDGDNPNREVMRKRLPLIVSDAQAEYPGFSQEPHIRADIHGWLGGPMLIGDRLIGMIALDKHQPGFYTEEHIRLAQTFAAQAAVAIENARLFQEREFLLETSKMVSSAQDLDQSLQTLAERLVHSLVVTFCRISLLDDTDRILITRAAYPIVGDLAWNPGIGQQYPLSEAPDEAKAIETGQRQTLRLEESPELLSSLKHRTCFQDVLKAAILIPLIVGEKVFGIITLGERRNWERGSFAQERVALCEAVADQVAALIARMRLQEQIQREMQEKARWLEQASKARDAARHIASVMILEDLPATLESIVKATKEVADCDAVTLYAYDQDKDDFVYPPTTLGLRDEKGVRWLDYVDRNSVVWRILALDRPHIAEDAPNDSLMKEQQQGALPPFVIREAIKSSIGLPLKAGDRKVGVMFVNYRSSH
ncbi:MAG: GAF domain-containing protein, partial [Dehalococcoidia bacterium]|nr:GAF domain-containing protein [Dehalococcoidia bacterium]